VFIVAVVVFLNVSLVVFPSVSLEWARHGLGLWFNNVLPALLPFAVGINILTKVGFTRYLGKMLGPVMRPLFRVPGVGGFALLSGMVSGQPLGAKVTADLRSEGLLTKEEARRLSAFSNCAGPLFVISVVGVGVFQNARAGYFLFIVHIAAALCVGLIVRWFGRPIAGGDTMAQRPADTNIQTHNFGATLGQSIVSGMETMLLVGGFIILFNVIIGVIGAVLPVLAGEGWFMGIIEITAGVNAVSEASRIGLATAAGIISWGGLCIHGQSIGYLSKTDIGSGAYLGGKVLHASIAAGITYLSYPLFINWGGDTPVGYFYDAVLPPPHSVLSVAFRSLIAFGASVAFIAVLGAVAYRISKSVVSSKTKL